MADARITWTDHVEFKVWEIEIGRRLVHADVTWEVRAVHSKVGWRRQRRVKLASDMLTLVSLSTPTEERKTARAGEVANHTGWRLRRMHVEDATDG